MTTIIQRGFGSDNHSGIHPDILVGLLAANQGHAPSYGTDSYSDKAIELFKQHFGKNADIHFVYNGTAANILCLRAGLTRYQSFLCSDISHLNQDECGAPEFFAGKLIPIKSLHGKIIFEEIEQYLIRKGDQHYSTPKVISLTQPTELGTCYSIDEIKKIVQLAKKHGLYVHIDGARLANAAYSQALTFKELTSDLGVDLISFGGTKNGLAFGEAVIILNDDLKTDFKYLRKQSAQLPSKTRFLANQFVSYLENKTYLKIAEHSVKMAQLLAENLSGIPGIVITELQQSNAVFVKIPQPIIKKLRERFFFYVWNEKTFECRLMSSWDTTKDDITEFSKYLKELLLLKYP